jgi:DNA-3-methyladenine glycosylase I
MDRRDGNIVRCGWCGDDPLYVEYHDHEWGVPVHDDLKLFEFLVLESAQAGLNWLTILKKREGYRRAFKNFVPEKVARMTTSDKAKLLVNPNIIRNRSKIDAAVSNAQAFLAIQEEFGSFANYSWRFVDNHPIINTRKTLKDIPAVTRESVAFSADLKERGFKFIGPTIMYAHMQAVGMVNDHLVDCFRYNDLV